MAVNTVLRIRRGFVTLQLPADIAVMMSPFDLLRSGGGDVCPRPRSKDRRGCVIATYKLPVTRAISAW